jgi:DNA mismatch endonuclease, patch repair protein
MDTLTKAERSARMSMIKRRDSKVEVQVRRLIHSLGYRFRLHDSGLPGTPDLVFSARRKVVFVHGCFWHRHNRCELARLPKSRLDFWVPKLEANRLRDIRHRAALTRMGWRSLVIWECEMRDPVQVMFKSLAFLEE